MPLRFSICTNVIFVSSYAPYRVALFDCTLIIAPIWGIVNHFREILALNGTFVDYAVFPAPHLWTSPHFGTKKEPLSRISPRKGLQ